MRSRSRATLTLLGLLVGLLTSCEKASVAPVELAVGVGEPMLFKPKVAFAEYVELPGLRNELRITLASYEASCERFVPPEADQAVVTVVISTPPSLAIQPGSYIWAGPELRGLSGSVQEYPVAEPTARIGSKSYLFGAGGGIQLQVLNLDQYGEVSGVIGFEGPAEATRGATRIRGRFHAKICRSSRAPVN